MDDIEDLDIHNHPAKPRQARYTASIHRPPIINHHPTTNLTPVHDSIRPGRALVYIRTWGCSHNNSDSEYMAGILSAYGYQVTTSNSMNADLWVLNSCTVKTPSEQTFMNAIEQGQALGKKLVLAGCVPQGNRYHRKKQLLNGSNNPVLQLSMIGVQQIDQIVYVVEETLKGYSIQVLESRRDANQNANYGGGAKLALPKIRKNPLIEIIPINTGCLNQCTYCKTKHARGELGSYPVSEIVDRVKQVVTEGVVEIWLTSEDTGTYGRDLDSSLPILLNELINVLPPHVMLRVGMTNPPYILEHLQEIAKVLSHKQVYAFLHVPVQSGNDRVLNDMRRQYSVQDFKHVVEFLNQNVDGGVHIATDIICGFPTESDLDFLDSMDLVSAYRFASVHISQFYPRPGTPAARLPQLPRSVIKQRSRMLTKIFESYMPYTKYLGTQHTILVTELASDKFHYVGHTKQYHQVLVLPDEQLMGQFVHVEIIKSTKFSMVGRVLSVNGETYNPDAVTVDQLAKAVDAGDPVGLSDDEGSDLGSLTTDARSDWNEEDTPTVAGTYPSKEDNDPNDEQELQRAVSPAHRNFARGLVLVGIALLVMALSSDNFLLSVLALVLCIGSFFVSLQFSSVPHTLVKRRLHDSVRAKKID